MSESTLNGYVWFCKGQKGEVHASTSPKARDQVYAELVKKWKHLKPWDVTVVLAEKDGQTVTHIAVD